MEQRVYGLNSIERARPCVCLFGSMAFIGVARHIANVTPAHKQRVSSDGVIDDNWRFFYISSAISDIFNAKCSTMRHSRKAPIVIIRQDVLRPFILKDFVARLVSEICDLQ